MAAKFGPATIAERIDLTEELAVFRVAPASRLEFLPGQFASLGLEVDGRVLQRPYSMASAPHELLLEFFVELVQGGRLTPRLWGLRAGDRLLIGEKAAGVFYLDRKTGPVRHLMLCTVTGVAPFVSMIRAHQYELERGLHPETRFAMIHGASYLREIDYYREEMAMIARQGWFDYVPTISRPLEGPEWQGEVGRIEDVARKHADALGFDHARAIAYACGHPTMVENARAILQRARFPKTQIHTEKYFTIKLPR